MEEIDIHAKLAQIETAPHFSMIFDGDTEKAEMIAEHLMWLHSIRRERPLVSRPYKVGIYIRYFNQTRYDNYLDFHKKGFAVDLKKYRIRIHRNTLALLGTPKYIQLLVSPSAKMMAIQGVDTRTRFTHRVNLSALRPDNSYEIYSSLFVSQLLALVTDLDAKCTYLLTGEIIAEENAAVFPLSTLQEVESMEAV